jgi:hypothetical protein
MRDPIVAVLRMAAMVAIKLVSHVQELLGDHHFQRLRSWPIDARQIDQNQMIADGGPKCISAADRAPQPATQPAFEDATIGGDAELISWQLEERDVSYQKIARFLVVDQPAHDDLQDDG